MSTAEETIYVKASTHILVDKRKVLIKDALKVEGTNPDLVNAVKQIRLYTFPAVVADKNKKNAESERIIIFSMLKILKLIHEHCPEAVVVNMGEKDFILEYVEERTLPKWVEIAKVSVICLLIFFGAAFTIMFFNNDVGVPDVFEKIYFQVMGQQKPDVTVLEIGYSVGLAIGIIIFFNHLGNKKLTADPTPIQMKMREYESDRKTTLIENANRKGRTQDVE